MRGEAAGKHGNLGQSTLPNSCAPTTYTETGGPDLGKVDWAVTKGWGCYIHERWVISIRCCTWDMKGFEVGLEVRLTQWPPGKGEVLHTNIAPIGSN